MREAISESTKEEIVRLWLAGWQRDRIAGALNLGGGTVSNVISELKSQIGTPTADALRTLAKELRGQNITALQCAEASRFLNQLKNANILPEETVPFIMAIQRKCILSGVSASEIFDVCRQISELDDSVPIAKLPEIISNEIKMKQSLEGEIPTLQKAKEGLQKEFSSLFDQVGITKPELERYQKTRQRLAHYGKSLYDVDEVVRILDNFKGYDYNLKGIVKDLSEIKNLKLTSASLRQKVSRSQNHLDRVYHECDTAEQKLASCNQRLEVYNELENNGIYLSDLIFLRNKVVEIAKAHTDNNHQIFTPKAAFKKFLKDVDTQYDSKRGFERKLQEEEASLKRVHQEYDTFMLEYSKKLDVNDKVEKLIDWGRKPNDILVINEILRTSGVELNRIEEDLKRYGSLQIAIDALELQVQTLRNEFNIWQAKVNSLKSEEEKISRKIRSLLQQQDSFEQEFQNVMNEKFITMRKAIHIMKIEHNRLVEENKSKKIAWEAEERERMNLFRKIDAPLELSPLIQAARGIEVDGEALRRATVKAIELMNSRLDPEHHGMSIKALEQALTSLKSELIIF